MPVTEPAASPRRRIALVLAAHSAAPGAPPGVDPARFALTCLADTYEVLADLQEVTAGIVGEGDDIDEMLWPRDLRPAVGDGSVRGLADRLSSEADELVLVPGDIPDLPGLVLAKVFKALNRADACVAPARNGSGCVAVGVRLPWPGWLPDGLDLDDDPTEHLQELAPRRTSFSVGPDWHRMCTSDAVNRLDPRLEGWEETRLLLSG